MGPAMHWGSPTHIISHQTAASSYAGLRATSTYLAPRHLGRFCIQSAVRTMPFITMASHILTQQNRHVLLLPILTLTDSDTDWTVRKATHHHASLAPQCVSKRPVQHDRLVLRDKECQALPCSKLKSLPCPKLPWQSRSPNIIGNPTSDQSLWNLLPHSVLEACAGSDASNLIRAPPSAAGASSGCWPHLQLVFRENMLESRTSNTSQEKPNCPCATRRPHAWLDTQGDGRGQVGDQDQEQDLQRRPHHLHLACRFLHLARYCRSKHPTLPKTLQTIIAPSPPQDQPLSSQGTGIPTTMQMKICITYKQAAQLLWCCCPISPGLPIGIPPQRCGQT